MLQYQWGVINTVTCELGDPALFHTPAHTAIFLYCVFALPCIFSKQIPIFSYILELITKQYLVYLKTSWV